METVVLSLGGSLICPEKVDVEYLKKVKALLDNIDKKFVVVCGGGRVCREYIDAAKELGVTDNDRLDMIGIRSTQFNAELVMSVLNDSLLHEVHIDYDDHRDFSKYLVGAGFKPGTSTDFDAVMFAIRNNADLVINMSNIDFVFDKDPRKFEDAQKFEKLTWDEYLKISGTEWKAGANYPFDPIASMKAKEHGLKVAIIGGKDLENVRNCIEGKAFVGTTIKD